jgi:dCTP deaminase
MPRNDPIDLSPGVLAPDQVEALIQAKAVTWETTPELDASAVDLRLTKQAWKLREGQRPTTRELSKIRAQSDELELSRDARGEFFEFTAKQIYLVRLGAYLKLPSNVSARATGKSSIGRLDVITRLITAASQEYDVVTAGYEGDLHVLIMPQTFGIRVAPDDSVNQLRLFSGPQYASVIPRNLIWYYGTAFWHVQKPSRRDEYEDWERLVSNGSTAATDDPLLFDLTVDLADPDTRYVFKAKTGVSTPLDLRKAVFGALSGRGYDPRDFFEKVQVQSDGPDHSVTLETGSFYIMKSRERLAIPEDVAVEVIAISERIGDIRIHYAGFAHPGFGRGHSGRKRGTPLIFEVRATDMKTKLYDGSVLARIQLFRMSKKTKPSTSPYEEQELKLSKIFKTWPAEAP